jgi:ribonuclease HII
MPRSSHLMEMHPGLWMGVDENGLGARLGPMMVTAVSARVSESGARFLSRKLPERLAADLDDSKALVSTHNVKLGEAWARAVAERELGKAVKSPAELFSALCAQPRAELEELCQGGAKAQCFFTEREEFQAAADEVARIREQLDYLAERGAQVRAARTISLCTGRLNHLKQQGIHRFTADLHAMERLILHLSEREAAPGSLATETFRAVCGKVGGIGQYGRFFGPLGGRLFTTLGEGQEESAYLFPKLGQISFLRDADATDPLVMLASLIGKYMRELLMARIAHFYMATDDENRPSGYHDPVTAIFVRQVQPLRKKLQIVDACFERIKEEKPESKPAPREKKGSGGKGDPQQNLF